MIDSRAPTGHGSTQKVLFPPPPPCGILFHNGRGEGNHQGLVNGQSEGKMSISPFHVLLGVGAGLGTVLFLDNLNTALRIILYLGRMVVVALCLLLVGTALGVWPLPRGVTGCFYWIGRWWHPLQYSVVELINTALP